MAEVSSDLGAVKHRVSLRTGPSATPADDAPAIGGLWGGAVDEDVVGEADVFEGPQVAPS
ncbi:MAG: hypothetical protein R3B09_18080 [Nannocystaceae bacterium]